jgi:hypothetical protein
LGGAGRGGGEDVPTVGGILLPGQVRREIILRIFLIYFIQLVLQTWPRPSEQLQIHVGKC